MSHVCTQGTLKNMMTIFLAALLQQMQLCVYVGGGNCDISSDTPRNSLPSSLSLGGQGDLGWLDSGRYLYYSFELQATKTASGPINRRGSPSEGSVVEPVLVTSQCPGSRSQWTDSLGLRTCSSSFRMTVLGAKIPEERPRGKV